MSFEIDEALRESRRIANENGMNPDLLEDILELSAKGHNKQDIAQRVDVSRQTVDRYLKTVREDLEEDEFEKLIIGLLLGVGALKLLQEIFNGGDNSV